MESSGSVRAWRREASLGQRVIRFRKTMLAYLDCLHKETGKNHFWRVAALYGDRVTPRIRNGRVIRRPRYAAYTEWPRYMETALCRVYGVAALYGDRVMPRIRSGRVIRRPRYGRVYGVATLYGAARAQIGRAS